MEIVLATDAYPVTPTEVSEWESSQGVEQFKSVGGKLDLERIPTQKPYFDDIVLDPQGYVWLGLPAGPNETVFAVIDADGRYLGRLRVEGMVRESYLRPIVRNDHVYWIGRDELDVQRVYAYTIDRYRLQRHKLKPITTAVLRRAVRALAAQVVKGAAREKRGTPPPHFVSRHRHFSWWSGILVLSVIGGCSRGGDPRGSGAVERALIQPDFVIGLIDGDSAYLFGDVVSVAVDENGRTYVGDRIGALVRAYDNDGQYLARIARAGEGPGEIYGWPADVTAGPSGRLYVRDGSRVTVFGSPNGNGVPDSVVAIWPLPGYGNLSSTRSRVGRSGEYYYPNYLFRDGELPRFFYLPFVEGQPTGDTLEVPPYPNLTGQRTASYRTGPGGGRLLQGLSHVPFAPLPVWDVTQTGTILSSTGAEYVLIETSIHGDTLRVISGPSSGLVEIAATERADSARALDARLDTLPVPIDEVSGLGPGVRDRQLPTTLPAVIAIHVAINGSIWVETWPPEGQSDSRFFDVLDDEGRLLTRAELRAPLTRDPPPFFGERYVVGVLRDPDTGVERVVRFTIPSQPATPVAR